MINVKDIRAITEASRNKCIIKEIEETITKVAHQGCSYCQVQYELPKADVKVIAEYFRAAGFYFDYRLYCINTNTGLPVYNITVRW